MEEEVQKEIVSVALIVKMVTARLEGIVSSDAKTDFMEGVKNISQSGNGQLEGVQETAAGDDRWDVKTTLLLAGVPISCVVFTMGIVTLLVFKCIRKKRKK
ncbi:hypothetical protein MAR_011225 [Mya arenaria]|uniref:Uncharacterized protein n=1 Tax=Mya arenaria TaxID=6604 RepID=A0ABY7FXQ3_MYAAR|nr:hypothetical protein MAR_011225 [Mya arenaria]